MSYYKTIKAIQKGLYDNNVPDDLFDIIFDYYGDFDETIDDLTNKHCFYKILCSSFIQELKGYYCSVCHKFLELKTIRQLKRHTLCKEHRTKIRNYLDVEQKYTKNDMSKCCAEKWFKNMPRVPKKFIKNFTDDLRPTSVVIDFKKK